MSMDVSQPQQSSVLGSMTKAGLIGAGLGAATTTAAMCISGKKVLNGVDYKQVIKDSVELTKKTRFLNRNAMALQAKFLKTTAKNGSISWKHIAKAIPRSAGQLAILFAGVAGIISLFKSKNNNSVQ